MDEIGTESAAPASDRRLGRWGMLAVLWLGSLAGALAIYATAFASSSDGRQIVSLRADLTNLAADWLTTNARVRNDELRITNLIGALNTNVSHYNNEIKCVNAWLANTHISWGGGLPSGDYFLAVNSKDSYVKGGC